MEVPDSVQIFSDKYLENISDAFKTLYNEEQLSDVTICCKEGSLKAHKLILAANSPYFCKIFRENRNEFPILILPEISLKQMKNFIELLYYGITDVKKSDVQALVKLAREFEIKGVQFGTNTSSSNVRLEINNSISTEGVHNIDTRFKGKKRVAVDYEHENLKGVQPSTSRVGSNEASLPKRPNIENTGSEDPVYVKREIASPVPTESSAFSSEFNSKSDISSLTAGSESRLTSWAKKLRKFKCDLCPSSFKRSSHLSRHQLVHTGERPYSCNSCDKAFSRHDKLKSHMRKAHEFIPDSMYERIDNDHIDSESESSIRNMSPHQNGHSAEYMDLTSSDSMQRNASPLFTISHISSILEDSFVVPPKKGRGRPRKYPLSADTPAVLNSNQEPVSNDMKDKKKRRRKSWIDKFVSENEKNQTSLRLREKKNINNNEDVMYSQMVNDANISSGLICAICEKPFIYQGRLNLHMKKMHGISTEEQQLKSKNSQEEAPHKESPFTISDVVTTRDEDLKEQQNSEAIIEDSNNIEKSISLEELRKLLPEGCSLRPVALDNTSPISNNTIDCKSSPISVKKSDNEILSNINNSSMECVNSITITREAKKQDVSKQTRKLNRLKFKKKAQRGIIKYKRHTRKKCQPGTVQKNIKDEESRSDNSLQKKLNILENVSDPSLLSPFATQGFSPAIEISLVNPKKDSSTNIISQISDSNNKEELLITVIGTSDESNKISKNRIKYNAGIPISSETDTELTSTVKANGGQFRSNSELISVPKKKSRLTQKRKRGRPRIHPIKPLVPSAMKRGRGRPRTQGFPSRQDVQNYNLVNLPYGDLSYLTSQASGGDDDDPSDMMEPIVEINMDQNEQIENPETNHVTNRVNEGDDHPIQITKIMGPVDIQPVTQIPKEMVKTEHIDEKNCSENIDISEIENKIGLIGECTISVAN